MKWTNSSRTGGTTLHGTDGNSGGTSTSNATQNGGGFMANGNGSGAGDRRSIFYTNDVDSLRNGNSTKLILATQSNSTSSSSSSPPSMTARKACMRLRSFGAAETMEMHHRKCENLISYFTQQIQSLNEELQNERKWRDTHLAKILKALLCFETKLKNDQKHIRSQLYEKDTELNRLAGEMNAFRTKYDIKDGDPVQIDTIAQYCPNCRKQYYHLDAKDVGVQVMKQELSCANESGNGPRHNTSSDDGLGHVFSEARRSKRYMSKRTSGTFRDYLKSRSIELTPDTETSTNSDGKLTQSPADPTVAKLKPTGSFIRKGSMRRSTRTAATENDKISGASTDSGIAKQTIAADNNENHIEPNGQCDTKRMDGATADNTNSFLTKYDCEATTPKTSLQFESTDDWYASASDMDDSDSAVSKPYGYNAVNPVLECVNQILLQQSMDGLMDTTVNENAAATNAITNTSVTNNIIESSASSSSKENNTLKKRVQFSTQNSMVQVPRSGTSSASIYHMPNLPSTSTDNAANHPNNNNNDNNHHATSTYATIYSNEYEPIGSEQNSTNHYVDMESKLGDEHRPVIMEKSKTPPALPPKPANLMKLRQLLKFPVTSLLKQQQSLKQIDNESEPDYCSISEVHEAINTKVQIVVDVHKMADDDLSSASSQASDDARTDFTDETFADVPKLPNVAAIISPKKESTSGAKQLPQEAKFVAKSSPTVGRATMEQPKHAPPTMTTSMSSILSEINNHKTNNGLGSALHGPTASKKAPIKLMNQHNKMTTIEETSTKMPSQLIAAKSLPPMKPNDKMLMPIQAEFDWYNLDAEYGRMTTIETSGKVGKNDNQNNNCGSGSGNNFGVEYNLDAEFSLTSNSRPTGDSALSSIDMRGNALKLHHKKFTNKSNGNDANDVTIKSFDSFLEHTGLTAKPLPQKRKIFYSAPFI